MMLASCSLKTNISPDEVAINYLNGLMEQNYNVMDKYSIVENKIIQKAMIEEAMRTNSMTESEIYKMALDGIDEGNIPTNYDEFEKLYVKTIKKTLEQEYGENYSIKTTIISSTNLDETDKAELLKEVSDYYDSYNIVISNIVDFSKIKKIKKMQCKVYLTGTKEDTEDFSIYVVKVNNKWKVLNLGIGN